MHGTAALIPTFRNITSTLPKMHQLHMSLHQKLFFFQFFVFSFPEVSPPVLFLLSAKTTQPLRIFSPVIIPHNFS